MKHKVAKLEDALLDAAVAKAGGQKARIESTGRCAMLHVDLEHGDGTSFWASFQPSADWRDGGPIIEREQIMFYAPWSLQRKDEWVAYVEEPREPGRGATPLIAAMRAYVASKFGDEVEL